MLQNIPYNPWGSGGREKPGNNPLQDGDEDGRNHEEDLAGETRELTDQDGAGQGGDSGPGGQGGAAVTGNQGGAGYQRTEMKAE